MKQFHIEELIKNPIYNEYIQITCYCHLVPKPPELLLPEVNESEKKFFHEMVLADAPGSFSHEVFKKPNQLIITVSEWKSTLVEDLMTKNSLIVAKVRMVTKLRKLGPFQQIHHVYKVELFNNQDEVVDSLKAGESAIPKELKSQL